jgi:hypothetical protein
MVTEDAIAETVRLAKQALFDKEGKPKEHAHYIALLTFHTVLRPVLESEKIRHDGNYVEWRGDLFLYDAGIAELLLVEARDGDPTADQLLCNAAAVILSATGSIPDDRLRKYTCERLSGDIEPPRKRRRGRSSTENSHRNSVIAGWLVPPLLAKGFRATRNEATKDADKGECACSVVSEALEHVGIALSEKRIAEIWAKVSHYYKPDVPNI